MPAQGRVLVGRVIAGLPISGVDALEQLVCECYDPGCACGGSCTGLALFLWGGVEHEDWQYLCRVCCLRLLERGGQTVDLQPIQQPGEAGLGSEQRE
jgi:hypothetical protein